MLCLGAFLLCSAAANGADEAAHRLRLQEAFLEAWVTSGEGRRASALRELERLASPGAAAGSLASARALGRAWRAMVRSGDVEDPTAQALEILAESVELRAIPGVFEAGAPGVPLTVHVSVPQGVRPAQRLKLVLRWIAPDGGGGDAEPTRTSEAWPDAFGPAGFELFVRTPADARAGTWRLELELADERHRARAPSLEVECLAPSALAGGDDARARALRREFDAWRAGGRPATEGLLCRDLLETRGGRFEPFEQGGRGAWAWRADGELRTVVVLLSPARDAPQSALCGVRGAGWRAAAHGGGWLVFPWRASLRGDRLLDGLPEALRAVTVGLERAPRVLVARADTAPAVALPAAERPRFDAWVLSWWGGSEPRLPWPETPVRILRGSGHVLLDDLLAPAAATELAAEIERAGTSAR
jgi:hypothetical protein